MSFQWMYHSGQASAQPSSPSGMYVCIQPLNFYLSFKTWLSHFIFPNLAPYLVFLQVDCT